MDMLLVALTYPVVVGPPTGTDTFIRLQSTSAGSPCSPAVRQVCSPTGAFPPVLEEHYDKKGSYSSKIISTSPFIEDVDTLSVTFQTLLDSNTIQSPSRAQTYTEKPR